MEFLPEWHTVHHEGPTSGETFVSRKSRAVAAIQSGQQEKFYLGNLDANAIGVTRETL